MTRSLDGQKRVPVAFRYDAVIPGFLKQMAEVGHYAANKYGAWEQYLDGRLVGEKSPINHIYEHLRQYVEGEPYDHFEGDRRRHLVAVAYNALMEWAYYSLYGPTEHPFDRRMREIRDCRPSTKTGFRSGGISSRMGHRSSKAKVDTRKQVTRKLRAIFELEAATKAVENTSTESGVDVFSRQHGAAKELVGILIGEMEASHGHHQDR